MEMQLVQEQVISLNYLRKELGGYNRFTSSQSQLTTACQNKAAYGNYIYRCFYHAALLTTNLFEEKSARVSLIADGYL